MEKAIVFVDLSGGIVNAILTNVPELRDALFVFSGDADDVSGDIRDGCAVPIKSKKGDLGYVYTVSACAFPMKKEIELAVIEAAKKYQEGG